jgi:hypothetical protein
MPRKIPIQAVRRRYGDRSIRTIDRWVKKRILPEPEYINGLRYWDESELDRCDAARQPTARALLDAEMRS